MLLHTLIGKRIVVNQTPRCVCLGVGVNKNNGKLSFLLCSKTQDGANSFSIPFSSIVCVKDDCIIAKKIHPINPTRAYILYTHLPVYSTQGIRLGILTNAKFGQGKLCFLFIDHSPVPFSQVHAIGDVILLSPKPIFPIGQCVPAPFLLEFGTKNKRITKAVLKKAIQTQSLIRLTLSLPPFRL